MSDWRAILELYEAASAGRRSTVLATVIRVVGSAYRRPGAKMLIAADGRATGLISGGCLEQDIRQRARQVFDDGEASLIHYDNRLLSGCNGQIDVLLERIDDGAESPLELIAECARSGQRGCIATTLPTIERRSADRPRRGIWKAGGSFRGNLPAPLNESQLRADMISAVAASEASVRRYATVAGAIDVFFDPIAPPHPLLVLGGGPDVPPLIQLARQIGWRTTVVEFVRRGPTPQPWHALADEVIHVPRSRPAPPELLTPQTAAIVMTHDFTQDLVLLQSLLKSPVRYIGVLGPRSRTSRLLDHLDQQGIDLDPGNLRRLYSPIGLDLGAEGPEEVALSIIAEIKAVISDRPAGRLRDGAGPIHVPTQSRGNSPLNETSSIQRLTQSFSPALPRLTAGNC